MGRFSADVDGDVLRRLEAGGFDFSKPTDVEFYCYASDVKTAENIAELMQGVGFIADVYEDEEEDSVSVYFKKQMLLTYDAVIAEQKKADERLIAFDTNCDGWMVGIVPDGANERKMT